ncbi:taste receptor type 2 member 16-like [Rhinoderma darwinii]|uniref:taste receptor type 2 member 16-like n=1 Tax=Rhinoderma darwinii TaxID=43563 RepID=UPI003F663759
MEAERIGFLTFNIVTSCSGIFSYMFIAVSTVKNWKQEHFLRPQFSILFSLSLSSTILKIFQLLLDITTYNLHIWYSEYNLCFFYIDSVYNISVFFSTCLTSWLCSFYCINVVSFQHRLVMYLKTRLPTLIPWLIVGTLVISIIFGGLQIGVTLMSLPRDMSDSTKICFTLNETYKGNIYFIMNEFTIIIVLPFTLILVSLGYTFISLLVHVQRVQSSSNFSNPHVKAHVHAAKIMVLLFILNVLFYMSNQTLNVTLFSNPSPWLYLCAAMFLLFSPLQACILIIGNQTLRVACVRRLPVRCREELQFPVQISIARVL